MTKYHPIGLPFDQRNLIKLSIKEIELIRMMRKIEGSEYSSIIRSKWNYYLNEIEKLGLDTSFIKYK